MVKEWRDTYRIKALNWHMSGGGEGRGAGSIPTTGHVAAALREQFPDIF